MAITGSALFCVIQIAKRLSEGRIVNKPDHQIRSKNLPCKARDMCDHLPLFQGRISAPGCLNRVQGKDMARCEFKPGNRLIKTDMVGRNTAIKVKITAMQLLITVMCRNAFGYMHMSKLRRRKPGHRNPDPCPR